MELFIVDSFIIFICLWLVIGISSIEDIIIAFAVSVVFGGLISTIYHIATNMHSITTKSIGCTNFTVSSQQQFEVWRKEKHGGSYAVLRYNLQENSLAITSIEIKPGDIVPTIADNIISVDVIERYDSNNKATSYYVDNQSRKCLK